MARHRPKIWNGRRKDLARRHGLHGPGQIIIACHWCKCAGRIFWTRREWSPIDRSPLEGIHSDFEIDHIIPVSKGGTNDLSNLVFACYLCNASRSNKHEFPPYLQEVAR